LAGFFAFVDFGVFELLAVPAPIGEGGNALPDTIASSAAELVSGFGAGAELAVLASSPLPIALSGSCASVLEAALLESDEALLDELSAGDSAGFGAPPQAVVNARTANRAT